jgi:hypothetical protein
MKSSYAGLLSFAAILITTPVTASPALIVVAAALAAGAVGASASQQPYEAWQYTAKYGWVGGTSADVSTVEQPLSASFGTSRAAVSACRDTLMRLAQPHDVATMEVVGAGRPRSVNGRTIAPLDVRAIYRVQGVHEVTRSKVRCEIDRAGRVIATADPGLAPPARWACHRGCTR